MELLVPQVTADGEFARNREKTYKAMTSSPYDATHFGMR